MRTFLLLILCLAIPLQGFAALAAFEPPCPMESPTTVDATDVADVPMAHDCCNDADTFAKTGKVCKTGQECQSGSQGALFMLKTDFAPPRHSVRFSLIALSVYSFDPSGLWRPPSQL